MTRVWTFLGQPDVRDIVGQRLTTLDFSDIMENRRILFVKIPASLPDDFKEFIGTILITELVHAVRRREQIPENQRHQFCIFVDEVQHFASFEDFDVLFTEAGKYGIATTIAHQERYGQLADNKWILGATDAAGNKIFFRLAVRDAQEQAPEFAKEPPIERRLEREVVVSQYPVADLLRGHANPDIRRFVNRYLRYLHEHLEDAKEAMEGERLKRLDYLDESALDRLDLQMIRGDPSDERVIDQRVRVYAAAVQAIRLAQGQTANLLRLYERSQGLRLTLRFFDHFLTALMEGHIAPGQEAFRGCRRYQRKIFGKGDGAEITVGRQARLHLKKQNVMLHVTPHAERDITVLDSKTGSVTLGYRPS